jgi:nucleoside-diphosphate kinase
MEGNISFAMIKPDATAKNAVGQILSMIENAGFRIVAIKKVLLTQPEVHKFYVDHIGKDFFADLEEFITSGPVYPIVVEKDNAVAEFRKLLGATNPEKAEAGTIRKKFATATNRNACHGSDSDENASRELSFFFSKFELL